MKKLLIILFLSLYSFAGAESDFYGSADISAIALIPVDNYNSLINPQNEYMNIRDLNISSSVIFRLDAYDEKSNLESMFKLNHYPIGTFLYNPSDPQSEVIRAMLMETGESIISLDIYRLYIDYSILENLNVSIGRKQFFMGYGYGWNPVDNVNPLKNPEDPDAELKGVDSISLEWNIENILNVRLLTALNREIFTQGVNYNEMIVSSDISLILEGLELLLTGSYNLQQERNNKVNSIGFGFKKDIFGLGVYSEAIVLDGSRNKFPEGLSTYYKEEIIYNFLFGFEYFFTSETNMIIEYYFNGEGYEREDRLNYRDFLQLTGGLEILHRNSTYNRHYFLLNLAQPIYDLNTTLNFTSIYGIDSLNLILTPSVEVSISSNMDIKLSYYSTFDFIDDDLTESELSPIKHAFNINFKYSF